MATKTRKFQFYRHLSLFFCIALIVAAFTFKTAKAEDESTDSEAPAADYGLLGIDSSGYSPARGDTFFLLADTGFSSDEQAVIRLEGPEWEDGEYDGVDIILYRIPDPLNFLRKQPNLHRIRIPGKYDGEGLANAMNYVWDVWYKKSRLAWQRIVSTDARTKATAQVPLLKQTPPHTYSTQFDNNPQFKPIPGLPVVSRFRYPLWQAKPIQPPKEAQVAGSSSEFIQPRNGNVLLPLGILPPGLYLAEGLLGQYRAVTLVFVADSAAITKTSSEQMLVWTADKKTGHPVKAKLLLTDGAGTLQSGVTDADGVALFNRPSPERSYLIAQDEHDGVYVSENFYYDSEIHNAKLFAFTDRPLYRPGDTVRFKLVGRNFKNAQQSVPLEAGPIRVTALDPTGAPVASTVFHLDPQEGGDSSFQLPDKAPAGGYTLRLLYKDEPYSASFRVARYTKPHYDLNITFDKHSFVTGEPVTGLIRASYPGGPPVQELAVELSLRSQTLAMSAYEHRQEGRFPVSLHQTSLVTDEKGTVHFNLPPAQEPSRYTLRAVSTDGSSYRVSAVQELLIDPGAAVFTLEAPQQLSQPGETVTFHFSKQDSPAGQATTWEAIRLEDQSKIQGEISASKEFAIRFDKAGSYTVQVLDEQNHVAGSLPHWVGGEGLQNAPDTITILLDKEQYRLGETVHALISFPQPVQEALLTLERDQVHQHGLLSTGADWFRLTRKSNLQWEAEIPVTDIFPPNLTFSVLIMQNGTFLFQNKGIRVENPAIAITMTPNKAVYLPGEQVNVELFTALEGKPVAADLAVSVVDEMVYVLQPELAPDIRDFFGHLRRNQVRTLSSLNFHTYDQAIDGKDTETVSRFNRPIKLLERPRRENIDTAAWLPHLKTDENGRGHFSFVMPDSLTRWRMTARATTPAGQVGQEAASTVSEKPAYLKWGSPTRFREQDQIEATILAFNAGTTPLPAVLLAQTSGSGGTVQKDITLAPGVNYVSIPLLAMPAPADPAATALPLMLWDKQALEASLLIDGKPADQLSIPISVLPAVWPQQETMTVALNSLATHVTLPDGAREIRVDLAQGADAQWARVAADLIDYPYGCVEQTASRLIPLSLAYRSLRHRVLNPAMLSHLRDRLANERFRLAQMAGPEAGFAWWGNQAEGRPFFTAYAYFADSLALSALGLEAPAEHWQKFLTVYQNSAADEPLLLRTLALWLAGELRLPVQSVAAGVAEELLHEMASPDSTDSNSDHLSLVLGEASSPAARNLTITLLDLLIGEEGKQLAGWSEAMQQAEEGLSHQEDVLSQATLLLLEARRTKKSIAVDKAAAVLTKASADTPTVDRALALIFIDRALGGNSGSPVQAQPSLKAPWIRQETLLGGTEWLYPTSSQGGVILEANTVPPGVTASIRWQSFVPSVSKMPLTIKRSLYRLTSDPNVPEPDYQSDEPQIEVLFQAKPVAEGEALDATALYLDEVTLEPNQGSYRYGLLEVPLPPGADLDPFTWGMAVNGLKGNMGPVMVKETQAEMQEGSYGVPVGRLGSTAEGQQQVFRHLVRFPQRGTMHLPAIRYFSMYNLDETAAAETGATLVVQ